jgi:NAD(P)-dependent dehydrogenase (short-subunit alcohol dehydrogenase family)
VQLMSRSRFPARTGRVVLFTSGQYHGAMPDELAYIATKAALHELTASLAVLKGPNTRCRGVRRSLATEIRSERRRLVVLAGHFVVGPILAGRRIIRAEIAAVGGVERVAQDAGAKSQAARSYSWATPPSTSLR